MTAVDFPLKLVQYSGADLRALRSTNQRRHVVNDAVAKTVRHLGLLCTTRRRGRRSGHNGRLSVGWRRPHALLTVADESCQQPTSSDGVGNARLCLATTAPTGPIDNQLSHSSYESSHRIPTIISDRRCRNQLSSTCSFRPKHRDNCLVRIPLVT